MSIVIVLKIINCIHFTSEIDSQYIILICYNALSFMKPNFLIEGNFVNDNGFRILFSSKIRNIVKGCWMMFCFTQCKALCDDDAKLKNKKNKNM